MALLTGLWLAHSTMAATYVSSEAGFLGLVGASQSFLNDFSDLVEENPYAHPLKYSSNGLAYEITSLPVFEIYSRIGFVSTASSDAEMVVAFTRTNLHATGGLIFLTDAFGNPTNGSVRMILEGEATNTVTVAISSGQPAFAGFFTGGRPFNALRISSQSVDCFPALDHFWVAEGVPMLTIASSGPNVVTIRWPAPATGYVLQFSLSLSNPGWADVQAARETDGYFWQVTVPTQESAAFFRLVRR